MGLRDALAKLMGGGSTQRVEWLGPTLQNMILGFTPEELYRTQPHLRTVISFVARNVAHLGLPVFSRVSDSDRVRLREDPLARLMRRPNGTMTTYELMETLVSDLGLYDIAYWLVFESTDAPSGWEIRPIPPSWVVGQSGGTAFSAGKYTIETPGGSRETVRADDMLVFHGWNPGQPKSGTSPVETLKQILAEQVQAWSYRQQVWQRGGRVGTVITRPAGAEWSDAARERFAADWKARWTGKDGAKAGGTPILEDGMTINRLGFSAREDEWAEVAKVALSTVASVYHVNPVMVGILDNANFSNTREFRKMLYTDTLGPLLAMIEARLNAFLVPRVSNDPDAYVEFNIEEKLQGDFEAQAQALQAAVGRPWMTADEARALRNMPSLGGDADRLVTPMNVLLGGQASSLDSGSQNRNAGAPRVKAGKLSLKAPANPNHARQVEDVLVRFFRRQRTSVMSAIGSDAADWWDADRWNRELADDLLGLSETLTVEAATDVLERAGFDADAYDVDRTVVFLTEVAASRAEMINNTTKEQIDAIRSGDGPEDADSEAHVFDVAESSRATAAGLTLATTYAAFATVEAAKQQGGVSKTWLVTSGNPRPEHAAMNGETVGIEDKFSNGAAWPGDPVLGADGVAGCTCDVEVTFG